MTRQKHLLRQVCPPKIDMVDLPCYLTLLYLTSEQHFTSCLALLLFHERHYSSQVDHPADLLTAFLQFLRLHAPPNMNRYNKGPTIGGPSKATASTLCQKCLKRGHYSFECKAVAQERPYVSRPSRTQQLLNPKLVPKLTSDIPQDLLRKYA